jgi:STE24 endopeptidase
MYNTVFWFLIAILLFDYFLNRLLNYLNCQNRNQPLPVELEGIYDSEKLSKATAYDKANSSFENLTSTFSTVLVLLMFFLGGFALVDSWAGNFTSNIIFKGLIFFAILGFASDILQTPFSIYHTFVIEQKFGFNKTTPKTYILDKIKGWLLSLILGGVLLGLLLWFYYKTTEYFWVYAWLLISFFMVFMSMFYSNLIVPLFNKQTPLEDGELKDAINNLATKLNFNLTNIYKIDGSKRSSKANAYFTGLGSKKRIVLYDTLIKELSTPEIVAVLAHEIGHYKRKHTYKNIVISILQTGLTLYILSLFISNPALSKALGVNQPNFHIGAVAFGILYSPISTILGLLLNVLSRKYEYEADAYASEYAGAVYLIKALKSLSVNNLSNLNPHKWYVFFNYSHPTLLQRIRALNSFSPSEVVN